MKLNLTPLLLLLTIIVSATGCINLKEVSDYSTHSAATLHKFEELGYSFRQHCTDRCTFDAARSFSIKRETDCDCAVYKTADSVIQLLYNGIRGYFDGLVNLSNNKLANYSTDALQKALTTINYGKIRINDDEVKAWGKLSTVLLRATTDRYRKKKLRSFIGQANEPLQVLLTKFGFILRNDMAAELNFKKERLYAYYKELGMSGSLSEYEKQKAANEYYSQLNEAGRLQKLIGTFTQGLSSIAEGHQRLFERRNKLSAKAVTGTILQFDSDIQDMMSAFNQLKN